MDTTPLMNKKWKIEDVPDQTGRRILITGANSGLGFKSTEVLASKGAEVIMAVRNTEKGEDAKRRILDKYSDAKLDLMKLDLSSLKSIKEFADNFSKKYDSLNVLLNNAGVMQPPYRKTEDGFELQFGVNHLGHFALTAYLLPILQKTEGSRVISQSSIAHLSGSINFDDINSEKKYGRTSAYGQSKIANLYFAYELNRQLQKTGSSVISLAVHPGYTSTELQQNGPTVGGKSFLSRLYTVTNKIMGQKVEKGVLPMLYAATMEDVHGGDYIGPKGLKGARGYAQRVKSNKRSYDEDIARRLWELSEEMTGVTYKF